jgi:hypothetical protein
MFEPDALADHTAREITPDEGLIVALKGQDAPVSEAFKMENTRGTGVESSGG